MWTCLLLWGPDVQKTVNSSQLQFLDGVDVPVVAPTAGGVSDSFIVKVVEV